MSTCTPHFKQDAQTAWITQDGEFKLCIWLHPQSSITLEDAARLIDEYVMSRLRQGPGGHLTPDQVVDSMTFRGQSIARAQMASYRAVDYMRDDEPFSLFYRIIPRVSPMGILCPCFVRRSEGNSHEAPRAQQMHAQPAPRPSS